MNAIGHLRPTGDNHYGDLVGSIRTLALDLTIRLAFESNDADSNVPSHKIFARHPSGGEVSIGAAWLKTIQRGERIGEKFLSISIDDPSLPHALHVAAFKRGEAAQWEITWRRRQDAA